MSRIMIVILMYHRHKYIDLMKQIFSRYVTFKHFVKKGWPLTSNTTTVVLYDAYGERHADKRTAR
jgi:hypothetical protein